MAYPWQPANRLNFLKTQTFTCILYRDLFCARIFECDSIYPKKSQLNSTQFIKPAETRYIPVNFFFYNGPYPYNNVILIHIALQCKYYNIFIIIVCINEFGKSMCVIKILWNWWTTTVVTYQYTKMMHNKKNAIQNGN